MRTWNDAKNMLISLHDDINREQTFVKSFPVYGEKLEKIDIHEKPDSSSIMNSDYSIYISCGHYNCTNIRKFSMMAILCKIKSNVPRYICDSCITELKKLGVNLQSKEAFIAKHGEELGMSKWESCKQSKSRNKAFFIKKYGKERGIEKWLERNKKSSITLENMIKKYGKERGTDKYNRWKMSIVITLENMVTKYGEELGTEKYNDWVKRSTTSKENFIKKYGITKGLDKYNKMCDHLRKLNTIKDKPKVSKIEKRFVLDAQMYLPECSMSIQQLVCKYSIDLLIHNNIVVEFFGTYWHADKRFYESQEIMGYSGESAECRRNTDRERINTMISSGFRVFVCWEHDWVHSKNNVLCNLRKFIYSSNNFYSTQQLITS